MNDSPRIDTAPVAELYRGLAAAVGETVIGQQTAVRLVFVTLLCRGHSLLEGVPGVAKTLLVRIARAAASACASAACSSRRT